MKQPELFGQIASNLAVLENNPDSSFSKEYACNVGDLGLIPGLGRSPGEGKGSPLRYSGLENSMDCMGLQRVRHFMVSEGSWIHSGGSYNGLL